MFAGAFQAFTSAHSQTNLENPWIYFYNCQEETSVAVLQDHVTGKVFNTQPRNIA